VCKQFNSQSVAVMDLDNLPVGEVIEIAGRPARVVVVGYSKTIRFINTAHVDMAVMRPADGRRIYSSRYGKSVEEVR
jgi:hypothetical protein